MRKKKPEIKETIISQTHTMEYHKNIKNTLVYTQFVTFKEDDYRCKAEQYPLMLDKNKLSASNLHTYPTHREGMIAGLHNPLLISQRSVESLSVIRLSTFSVESCSVKVVYVF
jgi:hypothetical protein